MVPVDAAPAEEGNRNDSGIRAGAALDPATRWQIGEVLARYGHIVDNEESKYLPLVFSGDAVLDAQYVTARGLAEIQRYLESSAPGGLIHPEHRDEVLR